MPFTQLLVRGNRKWQDKEEDGLSTQMFLECKDALLEVLTLRFKTLL